MLNKINEVIKALDAGCYQAALALALTFPDIFGKAMYPEITGHGAVGKRYIKWFNDHPILQLTHKHDFEDFPAFTGEICYQLRCKMLHEGHVDIAPYINEINAFYLFISPENKGLYFTKYGASENKRIGYDIYTGDEVVSEHSTTKAIMLDLRLICESICEAAKDCYEKSENKMLFDDSNIRLLSISVRDHI